MYPGYQGITILPPHRRQSLKITVRMQKEFTCQLLLKFSSEHLSADQTTYNSRFGHGKRPHDSDLLPSLTLEAQKELAVVLPRRGGNFFEMLGRE